jgi:NAD(P)-dependent dehydrogenase (short-subunit alcohol dehydrogenase family)
VAEALRARGLTVDEVGLRPGATPIPDDLAGLVIVSAEDFDDAAVALAFARIRQLAGPLRRAGKRAGALLASVSRLGGGFGLAGTLDARAADRSTGGALAGLVKTASEEWSHVTCHAFDVDAARVDLDALCDRLTSAGPVEIGWSSQGPCTVGLSAAEADAPTRGPGVQFGPDDVVLITGGARGVTAEVAVELARSGQPALVLVGRSPEPGAEPDWLIGLSTEAEIKRAIIQRASERLSPREVEAEYRRLASAREILRNVARIEAAGSRVIYRSLDVRDPEAVSAFVERVRAKLGPITGLVHGAGVLADRAIEDKTDEDFSRVYATKVQGLRSLLAALKSSPLRGLVAFSSSTARFGRRGQADYAAANEVLNKLAQREAALRPECRVVSINWGPWDGGMVTPALKRIFSEEGITVIDVRAGARYLVDELASGRDRVEVVILGDGSRVPTPAPVAAPAEAAGTEPPMVFEREVSVSTHPFLRSHVLDGRAVLPVVVTLEWLAHGALHGNPGLRFAGLDDLRVFKGVILDADASVRVRVCARPAEKRDGRFVVRTELRSGGSNGHAVLHARADVLLAPRLPAAADVPSPGDLPETRPVARSVDEVYAAALFHGPMMQGLDRIDGRGDRTLVAHCRRAHAPRDWMESPVRGRWIADPLALDSGMQAVIVWSFEGSGKVSLPSRLARYRQFASGFPAEGTTIVVRVREHDEHRAVSDIDWIDAQGRLVARLEGYECVMDGSLLPAFGRNSLDRASRLHHH